MLFFFFGRENQRTVVKSARSSPPSPRVRQFHLPRAVLGVFSGHGHQHHMATMATPKLNIEKKLKKVVRGVITTQLIDPRRCFLEVGHEGGHGGHGGHEL